MDLAIVGIIGIIVLLAVMFVLGMPVSFAMAVVGFFGFAYVVSFHAALNMIAADLWSTFSKYGLTVIPLFIFMGYLAFNAGIAERLYDAAYKWMGHWRGGTGDCNHRCRRVVCSDLRIEHGYGGDHGGGSVAADGKVQL